MLKFTLAIALAALSPDDADQRSFWNEWNMKHRGVEQVAHLDRATLRRRETVLQWLAELKLKNPKILDLGCSTGWLSKQLSELGEVVGTDISDESIQQARLLYPNIQFECANFLDPDPRRELFDVVVAMDVISCVADQAQFIERVCQVLKPGGYLFLATPNRFVYDRRTDVAPQGAGQIRHWNYRGEIKQLLGHDFQILRFTTLVPEGHLGILRLVNSYKLNGALDRVTAPGALDHLKERFGLGQTIAVLAKRTTSQPHYPAERTS